MARGKNPNQISLGPGLLYIAPLGTAEPTTLTGTLDVAFEALGYTEAGTTITFQDTVADVPVAEEYDPVAQQVTGSSTQVAFALAQETAANLKTALNGGTISSPTGGYVTFDPPLPGAKVYAMLIWQSQNNDRRYLFRKAMNRAATAIAHPGLSSAQKATVPLEFHAVKPDPNTAAWRAWFADPLLTS